MVPLFVVIWTVFLLLFKPGRVVLFIPLFLASVLNSVFLLTDHYGVANTLTTVLFILFLEGVIFAIVDYDKK